MGAMRDPAATRTRNLQLRRLLLYPIELRGRSLYDVVQSAINIQLWLLLCNPGPADKETLISLLAADKSEESAGVANAPPSHHSLSTLHITGYLWLRQLAPRSESRRPTRIRWILKTEVRVCHYPYH